MKRRIGWISALLMGLSACGSQAADPRTQADASAAAAENAAATTELLLQDIESPAAAPSDLDLLRDLLQGSRANLEELDIAADPNQRPIRAWFVEGEGGVQTVYIVGHADGECCPLISALVQGVADQPGFEDAWSSFGYGHLEAKTAATRATLAGLRAEIDKTAARRECQGQVRTSSLPRTDPIAQGGAALAETAAKAYGRARSLGRPLMIWSQFDDVPRIVPALVPDGAGMKPLDFRIPKRDMKFPADVLSGLSMAGVAQAMATLDAEISDLTLLVKTPDLFFDAVSFEWQTLRDDPKLLPTITGANKQIEVALAAWTALPEKLQARSTTLKWLQHLHDENEGLLTKLKAPVAGAGPGVRVQVKLSYLELRPETKTAEKLRAALAERESVKAEIQKKVARALQKPQPILTDALLRGWPATFDTAATEREFDQWAASTQLPLWKKIAADLSAKGLRLAAGASGAPAALTLSNVVFRVREDGSDLVVTPYFILAGPIVQVVDPAAGLVRYEASSTDQNLLHLSSQEGEP
jgi:hypothetical protein